MSLEIKMDEWILWREEGRGCRVSIAESGDEESVLMWHIGLLDKNNKAIYQNDFFEFANGIKGIVAWIEKEAMFNVPNYYDSYSDCPTLAFSEHAHCLGEVKGNIYENPQLLEGVK
ncbi:YopX family protein [Bacillus halotolerans]|uniref:YopX family protein n=1 Tax=Bacillus halotolerans TaxID=260554 RepID=UPI003877BF34